MTWKITLPCTRAEAEAIDFEDVALAGIDPPPVLMTSERVPDDSAEWQVEAYLEQAPDAAAIAALKMLVPSAAAAEPIVERIGDADWVTLSQSGIAPVQAGRFYVHTAHNRGEVPPGARAFRIDAGLAFGTGGHATTSGCLAELDRLRRTGVVYRNLADIGTGTGLLAFAALHLWPAAWAIASDIDPVAIRVSRDNAGINGVRLGNERGALALVAAPGMDHADLQARAPYDLLIANILAGPLIELAPVFSAALAPGGTLVLAGLIDAQVASVVRAYRREGLRLAAVRPQDGWPTLRLVKRPRYGRDRAPRPAPAPRVAPGFGSW